MPAIVVMVTGYADQSGHTEYVIKSSVDDVQTTSQQRYSSFVGLHDTLATKLSKLPAAFPVGKAMFMSAAIKQERVAKLQAYLRTAVAAGGERPPRELLRFLKIDPAIFSPPEGGGGGSGSSEPSGGSSARPAEPFAAFNGAFIPERPDDVNEGMREGIKAGDTPLCLELLASKADPNYRDRQGNTPLHMSCLFNRTEVAKALLLAGSDLTLKNGAGELPERMASVSLKMKFNAFKATGKV